jgi:hypothetical protein
MTVAAELHQSRVIRDAFWSPILKAKARQDRAFAFIDYNMLHAYQ